MSKLDPYLRSIEKFSATGAILSSGQAIVLRFPTGDRSATQVTPHDQLVMMVREVAPPAAYDLVDNNRPARFELDSNGTRYYLAVTPKPGAWQVVIDTQPTAAPPPRLQTPPAGVPVAAPAAAAPAMEIERGQYDATGISEDSAPTSGSTLLDQLTRTARGARATDLYLASGSQAQQRVGSDLVPVGNELDSEVISRELGIIAPAPARTAWTDGDGAAVFAYGDGLGRVRVTLGRDRRGPCAALRLLPDEPPALDRLNLSAASAWLDGAGLVLVAGPSGSGKTIVLAALVKTLGDKRRRVIAIEEPIELVQGGDTISQREVGEHVVSTAAGIHGAMAEGADAIAVGAVTSAETARAVVDAVAGGHLVIATIVAPVAAAALDRLLAQLPGDVRDGSRSVLGPALVGIVRPIASREGRRYEVVAGSPRG